MKMLKMKVTVLQPNKKGVNLPMVVMRHLSLSLSLSLSPHREAGDDFMPWVITKRRNRGKEINERKQKKKKSKERK